MRSERFREYEARERERERTERDREEFHRLRAQSRQHLSSGYVDHTAVGRDINRRFSGGW